MIDQNKITQELTNWLVNFVEKPHPALNDWPPCPYAKQARIKGDLEIRFAETANLEQAARDCLPALKGKEVIIVCFDHTEISGDDLAAMVSKLNSEIMKDNYVILEDHPDVLEVINGVTMTFGKCGLLVIALLDKLNDASKKLRAQGYYDVWSEENLEYTVNWRYHLPG